MEFSDKDAKKILVLGILIILIILVFFVLRPILLSIFGGLILAFIFNPVYKWILKYIKYKNISAAIITILIIFAIVLLFWLLTPVLSKQFFELFRLSDQINMDAIIKTILPSASDQLVNQLSLTANNSIGKIGSTILNSLLNLLVNFGTIALHLLLVGFVFFFTLRDEDKLKEFCSGLSPLNKDQEKKIIFQFKNITSSIIYGQIVIGILQGILAGISFFIVGVPNAIILTVISMILGTIPMIGVGIIYIPVAIFLILGNAPPLTVILFLAYNLLFVSTIDNFLRAHLISRKTQMSQAIVIIGMIGGIFVFGILGLILGPLILGYFITLLRVYKDKTLTSLFTS